MSVEKQIFELMDHPATKEQGFRLLMNSYQKDIYWHIRSIVHTHEDADDVIQNTFIKVFRYFDRFKRESNLFTWIYRIATNESLTHLKKIKRTQTDQLDNVYTISRTETNVMESDEILAKLSAVVNQLPEKQRLVFNMRYYEEMPYKKMSEILETSVGALKASYHIAIKKIEAELTA